MQFENTSPTLPIVGELDGLALDVKKLLQRLVKQLPLLTIFSAGVRREPCHDAMSSRKF
jgi:hypothetical protein